MTSRYVRKAVPMEIRAVQRSTTQQQQQQQLHHHHAPLPEAVDEDLPTDYLATVNHAIVSYNSTPASSGRSSPSNAEFHSALTISQGGWTTGNTTERSSVDSSCYSLDEFDRKAASTVNQHFEEFESLLFEGPRGTGSSVHRECQEWVTQFPHLRVLGKQLMSPSDSGYLFIATDSSSNTTPRPSTSGTFDLSLTEHDLSAGSDTQGLTLSGRKVKATRAPQEVSSHVSARTKALDSNHSSSDFGFLHEEIFAQDGIYEDIIAVDYKNIYEDNMEHKKQITPRRRRVGYPPITPNACVKDCVSSGAFDKMWCEIMSWLRLLLRRYALELEAKKSTGSLEHILAPPRPVRTSSFFFTPQNTQISPDRTLPALYVSRMELRDRNSQGMSSAEMTDSVVLGESTHTPPVPAQKTSSRPSTMHHPRRRPSQSQHLDPLREPSKVLSSEEGRNLQSIPRNVLSVKQIGPPGPHRLSPPPIQMPGRLPPLESSSSGPSQRRVGCRASSAIDNKEGRKHGGRERNDSTCEVSRPSTTIAFRSDTPFGGIHNLRSSTPMVPSIPARHLYVMGANSANAAGNNGGLNVMGNGLYPSAEPAPNILEDHEGSPMDRHNQWIANTPSFSFFKLRRSLRN